MLLSGRPNQLILAPPTSTSHCQCHHLPSRARMYQVNKNRIRGNWSISHAHYHGLSKSIGPIHPSSSHFLSSLALYLPIIIHSSFFVFVKNSCFHVPNAISSSPSLYIKCVSSMNSIYPPIYSFFFSFGQFASYILNFAEVCSKVDCTVGIY